jgi:hypothetical protein
MMPGYQLGSTPLIATASGGAGATMGHECGVYCRDGQHADITFSDVPPDGDAAELLSLMRHDARLHLGYDVLDIRPAELPPQISPRDGMKVYPWLVRFRWLDED